MTLQLKRLISKKQQHYNKAKRTKRSTDWAEYRSIQGQVHQSIHNEHRNCIAKILSSSSNLNVNKPFWHSIMSRIKIKLELAHYRLWSRNHPCQKAEVLTVHFIQYSQLKTQVQYQHWQYQHIHPYLKLALPSMVF